MLYSVEVSSPRSRVKLKLPLEENLDLSMGLSYFVTDITGLDPVAATISKSELVGFDGVYIQGAYLDVRNIVITLRMNPDYAANTVDSLRNNLYKYFMPKTEIDMEFLDTSHPVRKISGMVESLTFPIFTDKPTATISILCPDPKFSSEEEFEETFQSTAQGNEEIVNYPGTSNGGFILTMTPNVVMNGQQFTLDVSSEAGRPQTMNFAVFANTTETLTIKTNPEDKEIYVVKSSGRVSMLHTVSIASVWPELEMGDNRIRLYSASVPQDYTLTFSPKYGGL